MPPPDAATLDAQRTTTDEMLRVAAARFIADHLPTIVAYVLVMCVITLERVAVPHFYGKILERLKSEAFDDAMRVFFVLVALFVGFQVFDVVLTMLDAKLLPPLEAYVRERLMDTIVQRHSENYRELDLGNVTSKLIKLPANLRTAFYQTKVFFFNHVLTVLITGGYLLWCHWAFGAIYAASFASLALVAWHFCARCIPLSYAREASFDATQETMQDILLNLLSVYNAQTEAREHRHVVEANRDTIRHTRAHMLCGIPYHAVFSFIFVLAFASITGVGIELYRRKQIALATLVSSFIVTFSVIKIGARLYYDCDSFAYLYGSMKVVADYVQNMPAPRPKSKDDHTIVPPNATRAAGERETGDAARGIDIELKHVTFVYGGAVPDHQPRRRQPRRRRRRQPRRHLVLRDLSLRIPRHERVAIVGSIGSGKSSLAQLLLRLQTHESGQITWNGRDISRVDAGALRKRTVYVPQHPRLFNRTLWENISYGNPAVRPPAVYALLRSLQMHDVEQTFREKMDDPVGKQGSHLSGGQRQIVWLLRALLNPSADLIILDEPTSSLDAHSRRQVLRAIEQVSRRCTLIVVTHDDTLLSLVNRVVHIERGRIVDDRRV